MAATSTAPAPTGGTFDAIATITTIHLALIAVLALLTVVAIVYGMTQRRRRRAAEVEEQARVDSLGGAAPLAEADPVAAAPGAEQAPVASAAPLDRPEREKTTTPEPVARPATPPTGDEPAPEQALLTQIKGLGPKVRARLAELGVTRVDQLAALTDDEADALDAQLGAFRGRIARDRWVEQARFLAAGDVRGFEAVFGRL